MVHLWRLQRTDFRQQKSCTPGGIYGDFGKVITAIYTTPGNVAFQEPVGSVPCVEFGKPFCVRDQLGTVVPAQSLVADPSAAGTVEMSCSYWTVAVSGTVWTATTKRKFVFHSSISVGGTVPNIESELTGASNIGIFEMGNRLWRTGDYTPESMLQKIPSGGVVPKDQRVLFEAFPPKCTRMPKVIGPSSIQGLSRQDALRYGLLVTLDQDVIFTKGKGVLGTTANKGSDVMFFVATPPSQADVTACYRRVQDVVISGRCADRDFVSNEVRIEHPFFQELAPYFSCCRKCQLNND